MIPREFLFLASLQERRVLGVVVGERLEGRVCRLVARLGVVRPVKEHRAQPARHRDDWLLGIDGPRQLDEFPGRAQIDHVGDLEEGKLVRILLGGGRAGDHHRIFVERDVLLQPARGLGGNHVGKRAVKAVPDRLFVPADELLLKRGRSLAALLAVRGHTRHDVLGQSGGRQLRRASP